MKVDGVQDIQSIMKADGISDIQPTVMVDVLSSTDISSTDGRVDKLRGSSTVQDKISLLLFPEIETSTFF